MNTTTKISIDHISKVYNMYNTPTDRLKEALSIRNRCYHTEFYALKDISFDVAKGEIVGIIGRNGAGKSTLLKIITGVLQPTSGNLSVSGRISSLLELGAGFNPEYTGMENIYFYGTIMGLSKAEINEKLDSILEFAEIGDYIIQPIKTYSSGMFARLAFSCAINVDPDILIVDEILSVGDIRFQAKCFKKFKEFKQKGVTILYVGHDISLMRSFCDRCIWMNKGEIVNIGDPTYVSAKYVEYMYQDDCSSFTTYKAFSAEQDEEMKVEENSNSENAVQSDVPEAEMTDITTTDSVARDSRIRNGQPLAHWGSNVGMIRNVSMTVNGEEFVSCSPMDNVTISFSIPYMANVDYKYLSAAFSIKNKEGLDLIVKTTYDSNVTLDGYGHKNLTFRFSFQPCLTNGDYYLILALENRTQAVISYYEYIEGAKYFKIYQDGNQFGMFLPEVKIDVEGVNNGHNQF